MRAVQRLLPMLNNQEKALLRKAGHQIDKPFLLGKGEVDVSFLSTIDAALKAHELVKVKLLSSSALKIHDVATEICAALKAETVFIVGHTALIYRPSEKRIYLK